MQILPRQGKMLPLSSRPPLEFQSRSTTKGNSTTDQLFTNVNIFVFKCPRTHMTETFMVESFYLKHKLCNVLEVSAIKYPLLGIEGEQKNKSYCFTSMIFFKIFLKRILSASAFFLRRLCPFCAPFSRSFIDFNALKKMIFRTATLLH